MSTARDVPLLFLAFNRPDLTAQVMGRIRTCAPRRLFIALDGPRQGDLAACEAVRQIVHNVDWDADVQYLEREHNLGCRDAVNGAIDWFFAHVDRGMVIEDDILFDPSFVPFCSELLERYADDERVAMISGVNLAGTASTNGASYLFGHGGIWGWATWRRAWQHNDVALGGWDDDRQRSAAREFLGEAEWRQLAPRFADVRAGLVDTWDYQWSFTRASIGGLTVIPRQNLIQNLGFRADATHTFDNTSPFSRLVTHAADDPVRHPDRVAFDRAYQARVSRLEHPPTLIKAQRRLLRVARGVRS